jgi:hypothetical protein
MVTISPSDPTTAHQVLVCPIAQLEMWPELVRCEGVHAHRVNIILRTMKAGSSTGVNRLCEPGSNTSRVEAAQLDLPVSYKSTQELQSFRTPQAQAECDVTEACYINPSELGAQAAWP